MNLSFTEEQNILRDTVKNICSDFCSTKDIRAIENDPTGIHQPLWEKFKDAGLLTMMLPEEYGGMGLNMIDRAVIYQELGSALATGPHFESAIMAVSLINNAGSEQQKSTLLEALGHGDMTISIAWLEADNGFEPEGVQLRAKKNANGFILDGTKRHVFYARAADKLIVLARTGDAATHVDLFIVDTDQPGITLEQQFSMASDAQYKVDFDNVEVKESDRIGNAGQGWDIWQNSLNEGLILLAAYAVGGAEKALDITVQYAKEREQFGKPLGAFQALSHYMADACTEIEGVKMLVLESAWAHAKGASIKRLAPMAKLMACDTYCRTTRKCEQIHGGYGFTLEYDIQLFFRRAKQLQLNWCDPRNLEEKIALQVLDTEECTIPDMFL